MKRTLPILAVVLMLGITAVAQADYASSVLATGPAAYYRLSENPAALMDPAVSAVNSPATDGTWGVNNDADTLPTSGVAGPNGTGGFAGLELSNVAASFGGNFAGGNSDEVNIPAAPNASNMTIAFFMKTSIGGNDSRIFTSGTASTSKLQVIFGGVDDAQSLIVATSTSYSTNATKRTDSGSVYLADNQWHQIVVVRNGDDVHNAKVYVDGTDVSGGLLDCNDSYGITDASAHIGARRSLTQDGNGAFNGSLDEVAIWTRSLDASEVADLYAAATPEPATMSLLALGGLMMARRRRA